MEHHHHDLLTDAQSRISRNIRIRANRLARSGAVPGMDAEDIAQELRLDLIRRHNMFDPTRASYETFADRVVANRIASLAAATARIRAERAMQDLYAPIEGDAAEAGLTLADILPETAGLHAPELGGNEERLGPCHDVRRLLQGLAPACRAIALALAQMSASEAAHLLGVHRSTVYARLATIREAALARGLQEYLRPDPTPVPARR